MSPHARKLAYDRISHCFAVMYADLQQHKNVNDLSLNIHSENFFRDVFNKIYGAKFENANFSKQNSDCIDLIDIVNEKLVQITSTTTSEKIHKTLGILSNPAYKNYSIQVYYLLDKPDFNSRTVERVNTEYGLDVNDILVSRNDILTTVNNLKTEDIISLADEYFNTTVIQYTLDSVLQIVCRQLINDVGYISGNNYLTDLELMEPKSKVELNKISIMVGGNIYSSLKFTTIIDELDDNERVNLEDLIVHEIYRTYLIQFLVIYKSKRELKTYSLDELHALCAKHSVDLTQVVINTHNHIKDKLIIKDYNAVSMAWIILSYFFELCDIGRKVTDDITQQSN
ncbi:SMEK domain-containing protein [Erwinia typographi]|nr:SMEK domain-containing protein [Erwinia typographi]